MTKVNKKIQQEQGRSMTEMLGTLAIIGVLSVGSIAGYRYAMDNYYTNEILAGASERAVLLASQIAFNQPLSLREFTDSMNKTGGGTFSSEVVDDIEGVFGIKITGVKQAVCENILEAAEDLTVSILEEDGSELTEDDCSGDDNAFLFVYNNDMGEIQLPECRPSCGLGEECVGGACLEVMPCTENCEHCYYNESGTFVCDDDTVGCSNNSDCDDWCNENSYEKCYCFVSGQPVENLTDSGCYHDFIGQCQEAKTRTVNGGYIASNKVVNWWSAVNFCKAHGKSMVSLEDMRITGGYEDTGSCNQETCIADLDYLKSINGVYYWWVKDSVVYDDLENKQGCRVPESNNNSSCYVLTVSDGILSNSIVNSFPRWFGVLGSTAGKRALCK